MLFKNIRQTRKLKRSKLTDDEWYDIDSNGRGIIDVGAENYDDIFYYYDLDGENVLDKEFDEFLDAKADAIPLSEELALHFHVKNATETKRKEIERAVKSNYKREIKAINRKIHRCTVFTIYMAIMGLFWFGIWTTCKLLNAYFVVTDFINIVAWVFIWEAVHNYFMERRELKLERLKKYRFVRSDIDVFEYKSKKRVPINFSNNAKTLNNLLNQADKKEQSLAKKLESIESVEKKSKLRE